MVSEESLNILLPSLISSVSIIFVAVTFFIGQYEENRYDTAGDRYATSIRLMNLALVPAVISLFYLGSYALGVGGRYLILLAWVLLAIETLVLVLSVIWVSHDTLKNGLI
jgi:O-antigen/teichoic acid export membrane protein